MTTTTAALTARVLADAGIDRVFGLPGGEVLVLIDELRRAGIDYVQMRHEASAGLAAAVYGKLRRQPGVVLTTLGPGAANLMLPLASAQLEQEPLLAISAQLPDDAPRTHTHQLLPLAETYRPVCKRVGTITAKTVNEVEQAIAACMNRPYGPCYLTLSAREATTAVIQERQASAPAPAREAPAPPLTPRQAPVSAPSTSSRSTAAALIEELARAERPLVMVGLGVAPRNAAALREWLTAWNLPVAVTPKVKGIVDETSDGFIGVAGGMAADGLMCDAIAAADVRVAFGLDPVEIDKTWHAELPMHWVLEAPNATGLLPANTELVDHGELLAALRLERVPRQWSRPFQDVQQRRRALLNGSSASATTMWPGDIVRALTEAAPDDTIVTTDVGSHKYLFGQFWPSRHPETFWLSNGLSGMGYGMSAAIGAKLARPEAPVLAVIGDGGFAMNGLELETAARVGAPFVTVVLEDGSFSLIKLAQEGRRLEPYRMDFGAIDTVKVANACGVDALRTHDPAALADAARRAFNDKRSVVIAVPVDYRDYRKLF